MVWDVGHLTKTDGIADLHISWAVFNALSTIAEEPIFAIDAHT